VSVLAFLRRYGLMAAGMFRSRKLLDLADGAPCMHCCAHGRGNVVAAHSNWPEHGKGGSIKAHDCFVAFLCDRCHMWIDQDQGGDPLGVWSSTAEDKRTAWQRAHDMTMLYLFQGGRVVVR
jgi:hypothetical protein